MMNSFLKKLLFWLEALLFPDFCMACGDLCELLCPSCQHKMKIYPHTRNLFGLKVFAGTWYQKESAFVKLLHHWKYDPKAGLFRYLSPVILEAAKLLPYKKEYVYVPIPIAESHAIQRGFNQAKKLADCLANYHGGQVEDILKNLGDERHQAHSENKADRLEQSMHRFSCSLTLDPNKAYIIVDDIVTTGATLYAAAYTLWEHGAHEVYGLCLADRPKEF